jgi:hypothetical protein
MYVIEEFDTDYEVSIGLHMVSLEVPCHTFDALFRSARDLALDDFTFEWAEDNQGKFHCRSTSVNGT